MIQYRSPIVEDAAAVAKLHIACWREAYLGIVPDSILTGADVDQRTQKWRGFIEDADLYKLAAWDADGPIGFILSGPRRDPEIPEDYGQVGAIYIAAAYHRQGIGRRLMAAAAADWQARGGSQLALGVLAANANARSFYERLGGRVLGNNTHVWDGHELAEVTYGLERLDDFADGKN